VNALGTLLQRVREIQQEAHRVTADNGVCGGCGAGRVFGPAFCDDCAQARLIDILTLAAEEAGCAEETESHMSTTHDQSRWIAARLEALLTGAITLAAGLGLGWVCLTGAQAMADALRPAHVVAEARAELARRR
jgi:hypothetical protein